MSTSENPKSESSPDDQVTAAESDRLQSIITQGESSTNYNNAVSLASKQISDVIEFQEPSTSTSYSFKTEIRINILGEPKPSQKSIDTADTISLSLFSDDVKAKKDAIAIELEESFVTMDNCIKEKTTSTNEQTMFSRNDRTQRAILVNSDAPPPYDSNPPPYTVTPYRQTNLPVYQPTTQPGPGGYYPHSVGYDYSSFLSLEIRHYFIKQVFFILFVQLAITTSIILMVMFNEPTRKFVITNRAMFWVMAALEIIIYITLVCYEATRRIFPLNFVLLFLFTIALSYITAGLTVFYSTKVIVATVASTALICLVVSMLACQTWLDITKWNFIIAMAGILLVIFGFIVTIVSIFTFSLTLWLVYSGLATVLFSVFLLYDMQCIFGGRRQELSPEEYIYAALSLYVDIVMVFVYMLQLVNACSN